MGQKNESKSLSGNLIDAIQLVKSGDPELADMGRKWVKELIWGEQEKVEVKPDERDTASDAMIMKLKVGIPVLLSEHEQHIPKKPVAEGSCADIVESRKIDGDEITRQLVESIQGGAIGDAISKEFKLESLFTKSALVGGVQMDLMEGIPEYFDPHHGEWLLVRGKEHADSIKEKGWKKRRTFKEVVE